MASAVPRRLLVPRSRTGSVRGCLKTVGWNLQWPWQHWISWWQWQWCDPIWQSWITEWSKTSKWCCWRFWWKSRTSATSQKSRSKAASQLQSVFTWTNAPIQPQVQSPIYSSDWSDEFWEWRENCWVENYIMSTWNDL